jgi:ketosteroid isomerase-like protein
MLYGHLVKKLVRQSFENVSNHNYDELLKVVAPNVHHRFAGAHSIGGERHDKEAMRRWLERVGRVLPNLHIKINDIWVKGGPWHTKVFVQWEATTTLLNGDSSYFNRGLHVITMRWGKVRSMYLRILKRWRAGWPFKPNPVSKRPLPNKLLANLGRSASVIAAGRPLWPKSL